MGELSDFVGYARKNIVQSGIIFGAVAVAQATFLAVLNGQPAPYLLGGVIVVLVAGYVAYTKVI